MPQRSGRVSSYGEESYVVDRAGTTMRTHSFESLYIEPLVEILAKHYPSTDFGLSKNGSSDSCFDTDSSRPFALLVRLQSSSSVTWPHLFDALQPLRSYTYLRRWNGTHLVAGPVVIVVTGNARFGHVISSTSNPYHDIL